MTSYIKQSSCLGVVPQGVPVFSHPRPFVIRKLVERRSQVRVLRAPSGYGKSAVAAEYAKTIFGFKRTFWFNCTSACFLRDLDSGDFFDLVSSCETVPALCVFDDLVALNDERLALFSDLVFKLHALGGEVLITVTPEAKLDTSKLDTFVLGPKDLLLGDSELLMYRAQILRGNPIAEPMHKRVAAKYLSDDDACLLHGIQTHGATKEELLVEFLMFALQTGAHNHIEQLTAFASGEYLARLSMSHPHFGIDFSQETFDAIEIDLQTVKRGFSFCLDQIVDSSGLGDIYWLISNVARFLAIDGRVERASELVNVFFAKKERARFYLENCRYFLDANKTSLVLNSVDSESQQVRDIRIKVALMCAHLQFNLGHYTEFLNHYWLIMRSKSSSLVETLLAQIMFCRVSDVEDRFDASANLLEIYNQCEFIEDKSCFDDVCGFSYDDLSFLSNFLFVLQDDISKALVMLCRQIDGAEFAHQSYRDCLLMALKWLIEEVRRGKDLNEDYASILGTAFKKMDASEAKSRIIHALEFIFSEAQSALINGYCSFYLAQAAIEAKRFVIDFGLSEELRPDPQLSACISTINGQYLQDKSDSEKFLEKANEGAIEAKEIVGAIAPQSSSRRLIEFSFFGTPTCRVEDEFVDCDLLHRKNCLMILFFIFYNRGVEISREELIDRMWGDRDLKDVSKKRSFYAATARIKQELNVEGREVFCRASTGYYLNPHLCKCDLEEFSSLCTNLTFNLASTPSWYDLFVSDISKFSKPLLPQIKNCSQLNEIRFDLSTRLTDALITAADTMYDRQDYHASLWFANEAKHLNRGREDIYMAIMKAQSALKQRTKAVSTYFECKTFMTDELGLAPTKDIRDLYNSIITS